MRKLVWAMLFFVVGCGVNVAERNNAGNALYSRGAYQEALNAYQVAQVAAPDRPEPYVNAANVYAQMGRLAEAQAALEQALMTADSTLAAGAYYNLGNVYFEMELYVEAVEAYKQVLLRTPDDQDARYNLELALNRIQPPAESVTPEFQEPELETNPTVDPEGENSDTATPSPQASTPTPLTNTADSAAGEGSRMSLDEATRLLDAVQQDQSILGGALSGTDIPQSTPEKAW
jgi:tetratricopeptide (TPR) repeat protein